VVLLVQLMMLLGCCPLCVQSSKTSTVFDIFPAILAEDPVLGSGPTEALRCRIYIPVSCRWWLVHGRKHLVISTACADCKPRKLHVQYMI
jgi:hypothetical protein